MNLIIYLAEAFLIAYLMRSAAYKFKVPAVSGYVIGGVLLGGTLFIWIPGGRSFTDRWLFSEQVLSQLVFITQIALGTIALSIGVELEWKRIKSLGRSIFFIAFFEAFGTFFLVTLIIFLIWKNIPLALILGAVSSATAPAATVSVIQQYRSRGPLTNTILAVVGIDDAISFIIFAFALAVTKGQLQGNDIDIVSGLVKPVIEIVSAVVIGLLFGFLGGFLMKTVREPESLVFILGAVVLWITGITELLKVSGLLANMASGVIIVNMYPHLKSKIRTGFSSFMPVFYALFFIIGGAHLNLYSLPLIWGLAIIYFISRSLGKIIGASAGAVMGNALPQVKKWIGFDLLPQVGAAIALALVVQQELGKGDYGPAGVSLAQTTINVLLVTTLITEFIGPYLTKISLFKAGEAKE
ncbi:cation:proton antiporter [Candidatus Latescibacterota bacterium]